MAPTVAEIREFAPGADEGLVNAILEEWSFAEMNGGITTPNRVCHFMAQISVESAGLRVTEENLRYSAKRLTQVWPKRFPNIAATTGYAYNPEALANKTYGGRMGNTEPGDGWKFRGRGPKQITGRDNYRRIGRALGVDLEKEPDLLLDPVWGFRAAVIYWRDANCNRYADRNDIRGVTKAVNGGYNGLADRRAAFRKAVRIWGDEQVAEIGGKGPASSNIGRASLLGGGVTTAAVASEVYEAAQIAEHGRTIWDALGDNALTIAAFVIIGCLLVYIFRDRLFQARHEGL